MTSQSPGLNGTGSWRATTPGWATVLMDLLTPEEDQRPQARFDIALLTARLVGASTGAAAALRAAAQLGPRVQALVSRGGRPGC